MFIFPVAYYSRLSKRGVPLRASDRTPLAAQTTRDRASGGKAIGLLVNKSGIESGSSSQPEADSPSIAENVVCLWRDADVFRHRTESRLLTDAVEKGLVKVVGV